MRSDIAIARGTLKLNASKKDFNEILSNCDVCLMGDAMWERDEPYSDGTQQICNACYLELG